MCECVSRGGGRYRSKRKQENKKKTHDVKHENKISISAFAQPPI